MYRSRRPRRPSFMVVLTLIVALGAGASMAIQAFAGTDRAFPTTEAGGPER